MGLCFKMYLAAEQIDSRKTEIGEAYLKKEPSLDKIGDE